MSSNFLQSKLASILQVAERIQSYFSNSTYDQLEKIIETSCNKNNAIFAKNKISSSGYKYIILSNNSQQVLVHIIESIQRTNSKIFQNAFNPINIITKLIDREYMLDIGGIRFCYSIQSTVPSNYLLKSFACRVISSVKNYYDYMDPESCMIIADKIEEIHPSYDYRTDANLKKGGKKRKTTHMEKKKKNVRLEIISRLLDYIRNNSAISNGIIIINDIEDCSFSAINIAYTENKFKDAVIDFLRLLIQASYPSFNFKNFAHGEYLIPYDFRMKKYSCLINDRDTNQAVYIANLYNNATYEPLPCIKSYLQESFLQIAHPIVKLRFIYIDMFVVEHKMNSEYKNDSIHQIKMLKTFNDIISFDKTPTWIGFYKDEGYEKNKFNMKMNMTNPIDTYFI